MRLKKGFVLNGLLMAICTNGVASAQCTSGEYLTPSGGTVSWTSCSWFVGWSNRTGFYYTRPRDLEVIEGIDRELVNLDNDTLGHPNARIVPYETLRRARDEMRGQVWPEPYLGVHQCDDPECSYEAQARRPHPFSRKTAVWAIGSYGLYLQENPEDWAVMREFAIAVALMNELSVAVELIHTVYLNDSDMADDPIDALFLGIDDRTMRDLLVRCVKQAHRDPTPEAWLMVAVLMQGDGRFDRATEMLERAIDLGLDEGVARDLQAVLPAP